MTMVKIHAFVLTSLFAGVAACGSSTSANETRKPATSANDSSCPVAVAGTSVSVEDAANGAALVFVTTGDVAELRRRASAMATMHNEQHASMGALPDGMDDGGGGHAGHDMSKMGGGAEPMGHDMSKMGSGAEPMGHDMSKMGRDGHAGHDMSKMGGSGAHKGHAGGMLGVHSKAVSSDIEGGAQVLFVAGASDVAKLQSELRTHAQHLGTGTCAMGAS